MSSESPPLLLLGNLICGARPIRDPYNKWFAPPRLFPAEVYPNYLSGTAYLMSAAATKRLLGVAMETK